MTSRKDTHITQHTWQCATCEQLFNINRVQAARLRISPLAKVYCSRECAGITKAPQVECANCGTPFDTNEVQRQRLRQGGRVFCTRECYHKSREA